MIHSVKCKHGSCVLLKHGAWVCCSRFGLLAAVCLLSILPITHASTIIIPSESALETETFSKIPPGLESETAKIKDLLASGDLDGADRVANRMVDRWGTYPLGYYYRGVILLQRAKYKPAREQFENALERKNNFVPSILQLAEIDARLKNHEDAVRRLREAKRQVSNDVRISLALARHLNNSGREMDAVEELERARIDYPWSPRPSLILGDYYLSKQEVAKAEKYAREAAHIEPNNPKVSILVAKVSVAGGDISSAKQQMESLTQKNATAIQGFIELGTLYLREQNTREARKAFEQALAASGGRNPVALMMLARMEIRARKPEAAIKHAKALVSNYPEMPVGHMLMGDAQLLRGNSTEAIRFYETALKLDKFTELVVRLHYAYRRTGQKQEAFKMLKDWAKAHPRDQRAQLALGISYEEIRRFDAAMRQYEKVLEITPNAIAYNNLAYLYDTQRGDSKSLELAERALEMSPNNAAIMDTVGWLRVKYGSAKDAIPLLEKAVKMQPDNALFREHLAKAIEKAGVE